MDKEKMINLMVDRYEQFALPERTLLTLINLGDRYTEAESEWRQKKDSETIPFTWEKVEYDLADPDDRAEIRYAERNLLTNLSKEERFNVFCLMEIGRWVDYNGRFDMDAVNDFIAWADEWYVEGKHSDKKQDYLAGKATLSKWLRTAWDLIGPEYKRRRQLGIEKVTELKKLESYPHIITHVGDDGIVLTLEYKGQTGTVEFSDKDYMYFGRIGTHLYEGVDLPELIDSFRGVVDRHYSGELEIGCASDEDEFF